MLLPLWLHLQVVLEALGWQVAYHYRRTQVGAELHPPSGACLALSLLMLHDDDIDWWLDNLLLLESSFPSAQVQIPSVCRISSYLCLMLVAMVSSLKWTEKYPGQALPLR